MQQFQGTSIVPINKNNDRGVCWTPLESVYFIWPQNKIILN